MRLYHFTSDRGMAGIERDGYVRAELHNVLGERMAWLADDPNARARELGLTRKRRGKFTDEDRMAHRVEVEAHEVVAWSSARGRFLPGLVRMLESAPGAVPEKWWVSFEDVPTAPPRTEGER